MKHDARKYLFDALKCIEEIKSVAKDIKNAEELKANLLWIRFVEREFEIIGEALNKYLKLEEDTKIREIKRIIGLRNLIIHSYDTVDYIMLWQIIKNHLDNLEADIVDELNKLK